MGNFTFNNNSIKKTLEITVEGMMSISDATNFISSYKRQASAIPTNQYTLNFDCTKLGVSTKEATEKLNECFKLYKDSNFKKVTFVVGNNPILKMQLHRMATSVGLNNCDIK